MNLTEAEKLFKELMNRAIQWFYAWEYDEDISLRDADGHWEDYPNQVEVIEYFESIAPDFYIECIYYSESGTELTHPHSKQPWPDALVFDDEYTIRVAEKKGDI